MFVLSVCSYCSAFLELNFSVENLSLEINLKKLHGRKFISFLSLFTRRDNLLNNSCCLVEFNFTNALFSSFSNERPMIFFFFSYAASQFSLDETPNVFIVLYFFIFAKKANWNQWMIEKEKRFQHFQFHFISRYFSFSSEMKIAVKRE